MGVSRLDTIKHFDTFGGSDSNAAGNVPAGAHSGTGGNGYKYPVNGLVSMIVVGANGAAIGLGGATGVGLEVSVDGLSWVQVGTLAAAGQVTWQGVASWVRVTLTGGTGATSLRVDTAHVEYC